MQAAFRPYNLLYMQRRRERRYEVWESVVLTVLDNPQAERCVATVVDISQSGYRVLAAVALPVGTEVLITLHSVGIVGRVRHCEEAGDGLFSAGVEITQVLGGVAVRAGSGEEDAPVQTMPESEYVPVPEL